MAKKEPNIDIEKLVPDIIHKLYEHSVYDNAWWEICLTLNGEEQYHTKISKLSEIDARTSIYKLKEFKDFNIILSIRDGLSQKEISDDWFASTIVFYGDEDSVNSFISFSSRTYIQMADKNLDIQAVSYDDVLSVIDILYDKNRHFLLERKTSNNIPEDLFAKEKLSDWSILENKLK